MAMSIYDIRKNKIRERAIFWQEFMSDKDLSYEELIFWQEYFRKVGKQSGLLREFRENGIL